MNKITYVLKILIVIALSCLVAFYALYGIASYMADIGKDERASNLLLSVHMMLGYVFCIRAVLRSKLRSALWIFWIAIVLLWTGVLHSFYASPLWSTSERLMPLLVAFVLTSTLFGIKFAAHERRSR